MGKRWKLVEIKIRREVCDEVWWKVRDEVWNEVLNEVGDKVLNEVWNEVTRNIEEGLSEEALEVDVR